MIRKLEKIKQHRVLENSAGGPKRNSQWVTQALSYERSIKANL